MNRGTRLTLSPVTSLPPLNYTAAANGTAVDLQGAESALVQVSVGAVAGSGSFKVQESATTTSGDFTDVADADLIGLTGNTSGTAVTASTDYAVDYIGRKRYLRVRMSAAATTCNVSGVVVKSHLRHSAGVPV